MAEANDPQQRPLLSVAYTASSVLTGPVLVGLLVDWLVGTIPWLTIAGVFIGMVGLFALLIRFSQPKGPPK